MITAKELTNSIRYTYDAMGQLLTETVNGEVVNTMIYDGYGNIVSKNGVVYTYGDPIWKDRLTAYNGEAITYDAQGNPVNYCGRTMVWDKGRQLKSTWNKNQTLHVAYTYNANGIRTSKMINGMVYTYTLDGTKILREDRGSSDVLIPMYDNEDSVCGLTLDGVPYYFQKNLQGDVIAITDANGDIVARYSYDAWGKCTVVQDTSGTGIANKRARYKVKGTNAYKRHWESLCECVEWNAFTISTFVNTLRSASRRILDFVEVILKDCLIRALAKAFGG